MVKNNIRQPYWVKRKVALRKVCGLTSERQCAMAMSRFVCSAHVCFEWEKDMVCAWFSQSPWKKMLGGVIFPNRPKWKSETGTDDDTMEDPKKSIGQTGQLIQATLATISNLRSSNMAIENPTICRWCLPKTFIYRRCSICHVRLPQGHWLKKCATAMPHI